MPHRLIPTGERWCVCGKETGRGSFFLPGYRYLEIRRPVSGGERDLACHPERSEGSGWPHAEILRCAQDDNKRRMTRSEG